MPTKRDPRSPQEWQEAVDAADLLLFIDAAQQYGLLTGGPKANIGRCNELLAAGAEGGFFPSAPDRRREAIGAWLYMERTRIGISQQVLADRMSIKHAMRISLIERGRVDISNDELARLRAALKAVSP